jgi:methyl-accepting chemotaxis protein
MKFRRSAPFILISAIVLVVVVSSVISNRLSAKIISSAEEKQFSLMRSIVAFNLQGAEERALARASMIASLPKARALFAAQDRAGLLAEYGKMFAEQEEKFGVDQAQFHTSSSTSFLRLHDPQNFGDDLTRSRPLVVMVNRDQTPHQGFALARSGPAIFGIVPMYDPQDKHIGSFEFGMAFDDILDTLKNAYNLEFAVFIDEASLHQFASGVDPSVYSEQNRVGKFIRFHSTNNAVFQSLVSDKDLNLNTTENAQYEREALGVPYGAVMVPLRNGAGAVLGVVVVASDFSGTRASKGSSIIWQSVVALFAIVLLAGVTLITIRGVLLRPLESITACFARLASGDRNCQIPEPELLCDELKGLARQYEALRSSNTKEPE